MIRNLAASLITHERVKTTLPKARNLRPFVEKLVTLSKETTVHRRRLVQSRLGDKVATKKLFEVIGPRFKARPGGYLRILKLSKRRLGDGGEQAIIEFVERTPKEEAAPAVETAAAKAPAKKKAGKAAAGA
jgi:large subunit ribosomal protein L17